MRLSSLPDHPQGLSALIVGFTALRLLLAALVPLLPQEAYYWVWSLHPALSYFDHPPLASWTIMATTAFFGSGSLAIKLAAVIWSLIWNLVLARLLQDLALSRREAFWTLLAINLTLAYEIFGFGITPDSPLLATWVATLLATWRATRPDASDGWWAAAGVALGAACLSKYSAALLVVVVGCFLVSVPRLRPMLRRWQPWAALAIAAVVFLPVLIWNAEHGWASLAFQSTRRLDELGGFTPRWLLLLLVTQAVLVTPWLFWMACRLLIRPSLAAPAQAAVQRDGEIDAAGEARRLLWLNAAVPLAVCVLLALRTNVHMNWPAPAWWSLLALGVPVVLRRDGGSRRLSRRLALTAVFSAVLLVLVATPGVPKPLDLDNWGGSPAMAREVERERDALRAHGVQTFVFGSQYKIASLLRFHLARHPRTFAQDIFGEPALEYDYLPRLGDLRGATGLFVTDEPLERTRVRLEPWFDRIEQVADLPRGTRAQATGGKRLRLYRCTGYRGHPVAPAPQWAAR